jgi:hypothetical protein
MRHLLSQRLVEWSLVSSLELVSDLDIVTRGAGRPGSVARVLSLATRHTHLLPAPL